MKKFIQFVAAIKTMASFAFTGGMMLVTVAAMLFGKDAIPVGIVWQVVFLSLIYGALQFLAFSDSVFPRMRTVGRMAFLGASMLAALVAFALAFRWFPAGNPLNWLAFIGLYAAVFAVAAVALRIVFRLGGIRYDELLGAYKARQQH